VPKKFEDFTFSVRLKSLNLILRFSIAQTSYLNVVRK